MKTLREYIDMIESMEEGGVTLPNPDGTNPPGAFTGDDQVKLNQRVQAQANAGSLSSRYDPRLKQGGEPYTIVIDGKTYKWAGREVDGPGTGEIIKVPAGNVGIRGLAPVSVELGADGKYYNVR